jgi:L-fuculokinase
MAEPVILIFDIGKTNKKYFLINEQYKIVNSSSEHFSETVDEDGFPCDDIKLISEWIISSINNILQLKNFQVKAINFSAHGAGIVNVDADSKVVTPVYNY